MNKKKFIIFSTITIFILNVISHFVYNIFPNFITSLFFPVNESIMEHMKMIYTSYFIFNIILYFVKKKDLNNYPLNFLITSLFNIFIFLIIYLPIFNIFGENLIFTMILLIITIFISSILSYKILTSNKNTDLNILSIIISILVYISFMYFTYFPPEYYLWYDYNTKTYGIK